MRPEESEIARMSRLESGRAFHMTFRYIDDTLSFDNSLWVEGTAKPLQDGGVYPEWLTFNDTSLVRSHYTSANFLVSIYLLVAKDKSLVTCMIKGKIFLFLCNVTLICLVLCPRPWFIVCFSHC